MHLRRGNYLGKIKDLQSTRSHIMKTSAPFLSALRSTYRGVGHIFFPDRRTYLPQSRNSSGSSSVTHLVSQSVTPICRSLRFDARLPSIRKHKLLGLVFGLVAGVVLLSSVGALTATLPTWSTTGSLATPR